MLADPIRVFWVPGCSACVKTKEFLTGLGVPYESVNLLDNEQGAADLAKLGARSLPVVSRGDEFVFAQSLDQVAEFVGKTNDAASTRLPADELVRRWMVFLEAGKSLTAEIPHDKLGHRPVPERDRSMLGLAYHVFQVPDVFVRNVAGEFSDWAHYVNLPAPDDVTTAADILAYASDATDSLEDWWENLRQRDCLFPVETYYGVRPCWEILERQTWHSAQHVRQLQAALDDLGVPLGSRIDPKWYDGLPMPEALWQ